MSAHELVFRPKMVLVRDLLRAFFSFFSAAFAASLAAFSSSLYLDL